MPDGIVIEATLDDRLTAALTRAIAAGTDLTPAMRDIAGHLADETRERFETGKGPDGVPWQRSARAARDGGQTLVDTGDLLSSIAEAWGPDIAAAGPERSGGAAVYAAIHQFGGTIRPTHGKALSFAGRVFASVRIPARPYLGFTEADADFSLAAIGDTIARAFGGGTAGAVA